MYNNYFDGPQVGYATESIKQCKPDYELQAAKLKKRIDSDKSFIDAYKIFVKFGSGNYIRNDDSTNVMKTIGVLLLTTEVLEEEYSKLLTLIEEESK